MKLINADKVIEKLKEHKSLFCKNRYEFRALSDKDKARVDEIDTCIAELVNAEEVQTTEPDSDTISRAKAIDALRAMQTYKLFAGDDMLLIDQAGAQTELMMLPPARPERIRGRWTRDNACSECGCQPWFSGDIHNYNFCPNCGADMREVTT